MDLAQRGPSPGNSNGNGGANTGSSSDDFVHTPEVSRPVRLSIIVPTRSARAGLTAQIGPMAFGPRAVTEKAVESFLAQSDAIEHEVIVAVDGPEGRDGGVGEYLRDVFGQAVYMGKLRIEHFPRSHDAGRLRNLAVQRAKGSFLAFPDVTDRWRPGRLEALEPLLKKHDLILGTREHPGESFDWMRAFLFENWAVPGSAIIRRSLFEEVGGFPEGPLSLEYELWLRCLLALLKSDHRERFVLTEERHITTETGAFEGADSGPLATVSAIENRVDSLREALSLLKVTRHLPRRYWPTLAKRLRQSGREILRGKKEAKGI